MLSDTELKRFYAGDETYFAELYSRTAPKLRARSQRFVAYADDVDDVLQETWMRAYAARSHFTNRGSIDGWLWFICRNVCVDWLRAEHRRRILVAYVGSITAADNASTGIAEARDVIRGEELCDWVQSEIVALPALQRRAVVCRWLLGHSTDEAAAELNVAPGTIKATLYQARRKIHAHLAERNQRQACEPDADSDCRPQVRDTSARSVIEGVGNCGRQLK